MPSQSGGGGGGAGGSVTITGTPNVSVAGTPNIAVTSHTTQNTTLLTSSARTTEQTVAFTNEFWRGMLLVVNVTVDPATADITPHIEYQDPVAVAWVPFITATVAISATGTFRYLIYPGISDTEMTNVTENFPVPLPRTCRLRMAVADADSMTYSVVGIFLV